MVHEEWSETPPSVEAPPPATRPMGRYTLEIVAALLERRTALEAALAELQTRAQTLGNVAELLVRTLSTGGKVLAAGNGGSAAQAQHFTAELVGRFKRERVPYASLTLSVDTSILTAVANDYGYAEVFARQVGALGRPGDALVAFSTSGESENLVRAARAAHKAGMSVVAVTSERESRLGRTADLAVRVPLRDTALTQELHMVVTHILCDIVEAVLSQSGLPALPRSDQDTVVADASLEALA